MLWIGAILINWIELKGRTLIWKDFLLSLTSSKAKYLVIDRFVLPFTDQDRCGCDSYFLVYSLENKCHKSGAVSLVLKEFWFYWSDSAVRNLRGFSWKMEQSLLPESQTFQIQIEMSCISMNCAQSQYDQRCCKCLRAYWRLLSHYSQHKQVHICKLEGNFFLSKAKRCGAHLDSLSFKQGWVFKQYSGFWTHYCTFDHRKTEVST